MSTTDDRQLHSAHRNDANYTLSVPTDWVSGIYLAKFTKTSGGQQSYIIFVVRDDSRASDYLFQSSVTTYQAYNNWPGTANGGKSLYEHNSVGGVRAVKVSFNRPYAIEPSAGSTQHPGPASGVGAVVPKPALRWWAQTVCPPIASGA